ncbi:putative DNA binding domain-containing protein [Candidatus Poribacteria bacterium]|nr:putative DNA binding domain-containing protein [Candidatus Poribacteria bacterium]
MTDLDRILDKLAVLIQQGRFEDLETERIEIKPVPPAEAEWREVCKTACAFLNTQGGIIILGIREAGAGPDRRYVFTGWREHAEPKLRELPAQFTDRKGVPVEVLDCFPAMQLRDFLDGRISVVYVDGLPADRKFAFYRGEAYQRLLTGDTRISPSRIEEQEEFKEEAASCRELRAVESMTPEDLDLDKLNDYLTALNRPVRIETIKPDLAAARTFLERKWFLREGRVTTLGALVCGKYPSDFLGFRCQVHGYVDAPQEIARDKQDFADNILPLMESSLSYVLQRILVGVSAERGGQSTPQYPENLLRETINNALAHRDYSINKHAIISIKPGVHVSIKNPGAFRRTLLIEAPDHPIPLRRIIPEAKPRNPRLADVLRVYRKWEGRAIGMATMVNICLEDGMDLPYYLLSSEEVCLHLCAGRLLDERITHLLNAFDGFIREKMQGAALSAEQQLALAYLIKSEWANEQHRYTILLTPDNNHFAALRGLEVAGLIEKHPAGTPTHPVYVACRTLMAKDCFGELRKLFGDGFDALNQLPKRVLSSVYRFNRFSKLRFPSAKQTAFVLWSEDHPSVQDIKAFDLFYRRVRNAFNNLEKGGFVTKQAPGRGYRLAEDYKDSHLA